MLHSVVVPAAWCMRWPSLPSSVVCHSVPKNRSPKGQWCFILVLVGHELIEKKMLEGGFTCMLVGDDGSSAPMVLDDGQFQGANGGKKRDWWTVCAF